VSLQTLVSIVQTSLRLHATPHAADLECLVREIHSPHDFMPP
jgi:hypothetical protein